MSVTVVSGAYNLQTTGTGNILALSSFTAFTASTAADAMETGGDLELTANGTWADEDAFIVIYDNNVDTFIGLAETTGASDNALFGASAGIVINNFLRSKVSRMQAPLQMRISWPSLPDFSIHSLPPPSGGVFFVSK